MGSTQARRTTPNQLRWDFAGTLEDNPGMATLLVRSLQREGYAVDAVDNGEDALWSALENDYDAVVLDAMIPPPDGFEVCRRMRAKG
ncbi:MAG TPA: response regulator, partial [Pseudonocardiaceae bacterium]